MIRRFYEEEYKKQSSFFKIFGKDYSYIKENKYNNEFSSLLHQFMVEKNIIKEQVPLEQTHGFIDQELLATSLQEENNNRRSIFSQKLFEFVELQETNNLYLEMLKWLYKNFIKADFYFQKIPTIRAHLPNSREGLNLPAWHSDSFFGHSPREINVWFGLTKNLKSDFHIIDVDNSRKWFAEYSHDIERWNSICFTNNREFNNIGFSFSEEVKDISNSVLIFDSRCIHAAKNRSEKDYTTKFSIDYRIILRDDYEWKIIDNKPIFVGKGIKKAKFKVGAKYGYHAKSIAEVVNDTK